jgi:glycosyltransferase involved in cell wall biosynthesis
VPPRPEDGASPRVSILIPARDEERNIEEALRSVLAQDYEPLEIVVIDDRSTDRTGEILAHLAAADPRLHAVHLTELPPGWLGKCHALQRGAEQARGDLLLFADADVVMDPTTVRRAVGYFLDRGLDNLTIAPQVRVPGVLATMMVGVGSIFFALALRPWKARDPKSTAAVGIGAFNLVRAIAYHDAGGHHPIRLRPDDDLRLGRLLKKHGCRQDILYGAGLLQVEWYASLRGMIDGLMKNAFAGVGYRLSAVVATTVLQSLFCLWPFAALFLTRGAAFWLNLAAVLLLPVLSAVGSRLAGVPRWHGVGFPVAVILFLYILWRSALLTLRQGGIYWRGTFYPLAELRANDV